MGKLDQLVRVSVAAVTLGKDAAEAMSLARYWSMPVADTMKIVKFARKEGLVPMDVVAITEGYGCTLEEAAAKIREVHAVKLPK